MNRRDELAEQYAETHSIYTKELHGNIVADFKAGWDARDTEVIGLLKIVQNMEHLIKKVRDGKFDDAILETTKILDELDPT